MKLTDILIAWGIYRHEERRKGLHTHCGECGEPIGKDYHCCDCGTHFRHLDMLQLHYAMEDMDPKRSGSASSHAEPFSEANESRDPAPHWIS